jgi:hypothetical protein
LQSSDKPTHPQNANSLANTQRTHDTALGALRLSLLLDQDQTETMRATPARRAAPIIVLWAVLAGFVLMTIVATANEQTAAARVPMIMSVTGAAQTYGAPAVEGARLATEEANATGILPRIDIDVRDDTSNLDRGKAIAREISQTYAQLVVGPATMPMALAVLPIYAEAGLAAIGTTATGDSLTDNATFFRASFTTGDAGEVLANYLHYILGNPQAAVLFKDDGYGQPVAAGFRRIATLLNMSATYLPFKTSDEAVEAAHLISAGSPRSGRGACHAGHGRHDSADRAAPPRSQGTGPWDQRHRGRVL